MNPRGPNGPPALKASLNSLISSKRSIRDKNKVLKEFSKFLRVDLRLDHRTIVDHIRNARKLMEWMESRGIEIYELNPDYLREFLDPLTRKLSNSTYANWIKSLRRFIRDFLGMPDVIKGFRMPPRNFKLRWVPKKDQLREFYYYIPESDLRGRALFLFFATTGLRKGEVLGKEGVRKVDVDLNERIVWVRKRGTRTKGRLGFAFFNEETKEVLIEYLGRIKGRLLRSKKLFPISSHSKVLWSEAREKTGLEITPQVLRRWFASELIRLGVSPVYVDLLAGRIPSTILARHYLDVSLEKMKEIYDRACIRVLS